MQENLPPLHSHDPKAQYARDLREQQAQKQVSGDAVPACCSVAEGGMVRVRVSNRSGVLMCTSHPCPAHQALDRHGRAGDSAPQLPGVDHGGHGGHGDERQRRQQEYAAALDSQVRGRQVLRMRWGPCRALTQCGWLDVCVSVVWSRCVTSGAGYSGSWS